MENFLLQRELTISCSRTERGKHMQLGIRLHDIKKAPLEERLAIAKEQLGDSYEPLKELAGSTLEKYRLKIK